MTAAPAAPVATDHALPANRTCHVLGSDHELLLTAEETGGACSVSRIAVPAGWANPPHIHWFEDEVFYAQQGEFEVIVGTVATRIAAGQAAFGPRRVAHQFRNIGSGTGVMVVTTTPGGLERFFLACDRAFPKDSVLDPAAVNDIIERHGMSMA